jgi:integrase
LKNLIDAYFAALPVGNLEESTLEGMRIHERHLYRLLGEKQPVQAITTTMLQTYIAERSTEGGLRGRTVTPATIKKAIVTLRTAWNWGVQTGMVTGRFPGDGLKYPKAQEKPPFQTWAQIERQIKHGGLSEADEADLWDCLFLTMPEIRDLLTYVRSHCTKPFVETMFVFAAHTGARRSEMLRCKLRDIDFESANITIHERKRDHSKSTTRRVPMSRDLRRALKSWLRDHPGGPLLFCEPPGPAEDGDEPGPPIPISHDMVHDHFKRTLAGSKWARMRGWHCLRHSFASNCAAKGIDQRAHQRVARAPHRRNGATLSAPHPEARTASDQIGIWVTAGVRDFESARVHRAR